MEDTGCGFSGGLLFVGDATLISLTTEVHATNIHNLTSSPSVREGGQKWGGDRRIPCTLPCCGACAEEMWGVRFQKLSYQ
jgi:hypothetical protein